MPFSATTTRLARLRRHRRIRASIHGTATRPRLAVYRSLKHISAQLIDDEEKRTLVAVSDDQLKSRTGTKSERATAVGTLLAEKALAANITTVVFDRGGRRYHGRVKALADAARTGGLTF